jgi:hypothetical protein
MLTCIFGLPCTASLEQQVENGRRFIQGHYEERRVAFNEDFRNLTIAGHTKAIDDLLSDETRVRKVKMSTRNLQNHQQTILSAVIAKELIGYKTTPRKAGSIYKVKQSSAHFKHFEILRLTEDFSYHIASQFYQNQPINHQGLQKLIVGDYAKILTYSGSTRDLFANWFGEVLEAHATGIIAKQKPTPKRAMPVSNRVTADHYASATSTKSSATTKTKRFATNYHSDSDDNYVEQEIPKAKPIVYDPNLPLHSSTYDPSAVYNPYTGAAAYDPELYGERFYGVKHNAEMNEEEDIILAKLLSLETSQQTPAGRRTYRDEERSAFGDEEGTRQADQVYRERLLSSNSSETYNPNNLEYGDTKYPIKLTGFSDGSEGYELGVYVSPEDCAAQERLFAAIEQKRQDELRLKEIERAQKEDEIRRRQEKERLEELQRQEEEERLAAEQAIRPISNPNADLIKIGELLNTLDSAAKDIKETNAAEMSVTINQHTWTVSVENYAKFKEQFKGTYDSNLLIGPFYSSTTESRIKTKLATYRFEKAESDIIELTLTLKAK